MAFEAGARARLEPMIPGQMFRPCVVPGPRGAATSGYRK